MFKLLLAVLIVVGSLAVIGTYVPWMWEKGFALGDIFIRYAYIALAGVGYLVYKMKV